MNRTLKAIAVIMLMMIFAMGCNKPDEPNNGGGNNGNNDNDVRVTTYTPQGITQTSAVCGGDVIVVQGLSLNKIGVCWSQEPNPTVEDSQLSTSNWNEPFVCTITNLDPGTTYFVRAFALRGLEYYYGENRSFTTDVSHIADVSVVTHTPYDITMTSAVCGGEVVVEQSFSLYRLGVCWSKEPNPTVENANYSTENWSEPFVYNITGLEPGVTYYVRAYASYDTECYYGENKSFTTESSSGICNGHEYIDLGLPSGTLWATCNVGANTPWECGDYFAWGETNPKLTYEWNTYKYCVVVGNHIYLTKYCNDSSFGYNGFTDTLAVLQPIDDAAVVKWGSRWLMPTAEQYEELILHTTNIKASFNGILGRFFIANNGNCVFLPCCGNYTGNELEDINVGSYYSSTLSPDSNASILFFRHNNNAGVGRALRSLGLPIRPVCTIE